MNDPLFTKYLIEWSVDFHDTEAFEAFWSLLMDNDIDCIGNHTQATSVYTSHVNIYFKSIAERELARNLVTITK